MEKTQTATADYSFRMTVTLSSSQCARIIYMALIREVENPPSYRSRAVLHQEGDSVVLEIFSNDLSSFRAAINSYLRLLAATLSVLDETKNLLE